MLLTEFFKETVTEEAAELSDVVAAHTLIAQAIRDPEKFKHEYFEFLKYLREKHGKEYSTRIHQKAARLTAAKEQN